MECQTSAIKVCSLEDFFNTALTAVALSSGSESSGGCSGDNSGCMTVRSDGSTTRLDSSNESTARFDINNENKISFEYQSISLDKSSAPDFGDPFEGVFYRTEAEDLKTVIHFVSRVFYLRFRDKIVSDFSLTMDKDVI